MIALRCAVRGCSDSPLVVDGALCASHEDVVEAAPEIETVPCLDCRPPGSGKDRCRCARDGHPGRVYDDEPMIGAPSGKWVECGNCGRDNTGEPVGVVFCEVCRGTGRVEV